MLVFSKLGTRTKHNNPKQNPYDLKFQKPDPKSYFNIRNHPGSQLPETTRHYSRPFTTLVG